MNEQEINSLRLGIEAYDRGDYTVAFPLLLKAAEAGDREAQFRCGDLYQDEEKSGQFDVEKAMYWYEKAAKQRHAEAQCRYGLAYDIGWGEDGITDEEEAFSRLWDRGDTMGRYLCAIMYHEGMVIPSDFDETLEIIQGFSHDVFERRQEEWIQECVKRGYDAWPHLKLETVYLSDYL